MIPGFGDVSKTNIIYFLRHQGTSNNPRGANIVLEIIMFIHIGTLKTKNFENVGKDGHRQNMKIRCIIS